MECYKQHVTWSLRGFPVLTFLHHCHGTTTHSILHDIHPNATCPMNALWMSHPSTVFDPCLTPAIDTCLVGAYPLFATSFLLGCMETHSCSHLSSPQWPWWLYQWGQAPSAPSTSPEVLSPAPQSARAPDNHFPGWSCHIQSPHWTWRHRSRYEYWAPVDFMLHNKEWPIRCFELRNKQKKV